MATLVESLHVDAEGLGCACCSFSSLSSRAICLYGSLVQLLFTRLMVLTHHVLLFSIVPI